MATGDVFMLPGLDTLLQVIQPYIFAVIATINELSAVKKINILILIIMFSPLR